MNKPYIPKDWAVAKVTYGPRDPAKCPHGPWTFTRVIKSSSGWLNPDESVSFNFNDSTHPAQKNVKDPEAVAWKSKEPPRRSLIVVLGDIDTVAGGRAAGFATKLSADYQEIPDIGLTDEERRQLKESARNKR